MESDLAESYGKSLFSLGRSEGFPAQYPEKRTPVTEDPIEVGLVFVFTTLAFCLAAVLLPRSGGKTRIYLLLRVVIGLFVGAILMTSNYGQMWEIGKIKATVPYKAGAPDEIVAEIGLLIGLRSINITLVAKEKGLSLANEVIDYNERFSWTWDQGRIGFGPFAGRLQQEFREAQRRGLPLPILWLAEYFTIDGEGFRFGRHYRTSGWYVHIALWTAITTWILANVLFQTVLRYGALWAGVTGLLQLFACILWTQMKNPIQLAIPFNNGDLTTHYGHCFWLTLSSGILCVLIGVIVILTDLRFPDETAVFFGRDPLSEYEECHLDSQEVDLMRTQAAKKWQEWLRQKKREEMTQMQPSDDLAFDMVEMGHLSPEPQSGVIPQYNVIPPTATLTLQPTELVLKRGTTVRRAQRSLFRTPLAWQQETFLSAAKDDF